MDREQRLIPRFGLGAMLTLAFYLLAVCSLISYFVWRDEYPMLFVYMGVAAIAVRIVYYLIRLFNSKK